MCASPSLPCRQVALDDEQELRQARAQEASRLRDQRLKEAFIELKHSDKAKDMKEQVGGAIFIRVGTRLDQETMSTSTFVIPLLDSNALILV